MIDFADNYFLSLTLHLFKEYYIDIPLEVNFEKLDQKNLRSSIDFPIFNTFFEKLVKKYDNFVVCLTDFIDLTLNEISKVKAHRYNKFTPFIIL